MSRTRRSAWTLGSGLTFSAITMLIGFVTTPYMLQWLGSERFGSFRVLADWFSNLTLLDVGLTGSVAACLAPAVAAGDARQVRSWISAALRAYLLVGLAILSAGIALVFALPWLMPVETIPARELRVAGFILLAPVLAIQASVFRSLSEVRQEGYVLNLLSIVQALSTTAVALPLAWAGWGLIGQSTAVALAQFPVLVILMTRGTRYYPGCWSASAPAGGLSRIWRLNWDNFFFLITNRVSYFLDNTIVHWSLGGAAVTSFSLTQRLTSIVNMQLFCLGGSTWPGLIELHAKGEKELFRARLLELTQLVSSLGLISLGVLAAYNPSFMRLWVGSRNYAGEAVNTLSCLNLWFHSVFGIWTWPLSGTGRLRAWLPYGALSMVLNLSVSAAATVTMGSMGPLVGTLVSFLAINAWALPRVLERQFGIPMGAFWGAALEPLRWGLPFLGLVWWVARSQESPGFPSVIAQMGLAASAGVLVWWTFGLDREGRKTWLGRVVLALRR